MIGNEVVIEVTDRSRSKPSCNVLLSDFANMVKAFIGSNYLTIAFAFAQSGLVLGIVGLFLIALVTDHCCLLIVKCKYHAIRHVLDKHRMSSSSGSIVNSNKSRRLMSSEEEGEEREQQSVEESEEFQKIHKQLQRSMTYGDVGKIAYGSWGVFMVNFCLIFTQFGFCVNYFIFVGNTIFALFPTVNGSLPVNDTGMTSSMPLALAVDQDKDFSTQSFMSTPFLNGSVDFISSSLANFSNITNATTSAPTTTSTPTTTIATSATWAAMNTSTPSVIPLSDLFLDVSQAPDLRLLVITPLPIFAGFAFLRDVRHLGFVSVGADVSIFLGCVVTMGYILVGFSVSTTWQLFDWTNVAIFFGMVTSSYEGIGTVIPIESSMEGNRHNFSNFLHGSVFILTCILSLFGIVGYLRYGTGTEQMLNQNMPSGTPVSIAINVCLCVGVILTFPLQIYPVIELSEIFLFGDGRICGPKKKRKTHHVDDEDSESDGDVGPSEGGKGRDKEALLPKEKVNIPAPVAATVSDEVSTWKRNLLRVCLVVLAAGLAVVMRDFYAYVGSFVGALGSSLLAYILPCLFHLKLCWAQLHPGVKIKDILIVVFGLAASVVSLYSTIRSIADRS
ncbi:uncharacterized protein LOC101845918 [Aplysia californica]|uniref:Uncharacterized protein LOC101845918 n=1 Tax=Aplysia californica TaxID=6500 RepID=A0ABM0JMR3_APLCA|nr:uncharacterized protein LOC101845918 [Aplysia californica]